MDFILEMVVITLYLLGSVGIFTWQRKQIINSTVLFLILWSIFILVAYTLILEIRAGTSFFIVPTFFFAVFAASYFKDKRRLINGLLFNIFLLSFGGYMLFVMFEAQSIFLGGVLAIIGVAFLLLFLVGIYGLVIFLYWNSIIVLKKESFSLANLLTLLLALGLTAYLIVAVYVNHFAPSWFESLFSIVPALLFYFFVVFYNFLTVTILYQFNLPRYNQDYVIVLGAGLIDGERVTPLLAKRIDKAIQFYKAQKRATMKPPKILMSGGKGPDEKISEATAMKNYAVEQGMLAEDILIEGNSTNTLENMKFSKEIMDAREPNPYRVIFTSNNYHIFRAGIYARWANLKADGIGARTARYYLPNAFLREFVAILSMNKKRHLIVCGVLGGFAILNTLSQWLFR